MASPCMFAISGIISLRTKLVGSKPSHLMEALPGIRTFLCDSLEGHKRKVNQRTTNDVRATMHSFLDQAESIGEICGGFALAVIAGTAGISIALIISAALIAFAGTMVALSNTDQAGSDSR